MRRVDVPGPIRRALEHLSSLVQTQSWQIRELQERQDQRDQLAAQVSRKAEGLVVEQLGKRLQTMTNAVDSLSDRLSGLTGKTNAIEARIAYELDPQPATSHQHRHVASLPLDPQRSWEPVFTLPEARTCSPEGCQSAAMYGDAPVAQRLARVEKRLEALSDACMSLEEESSTTAVQAQRLEVSWLAASARLDAWDLDC
jgi:hypothetical protein